MWYGFLIKKISCLMYCMKKYNYKFADWIYFQTLKFLLQMDIKESFRS